MKRTSFYSPEHNVVAALLHDMRREAKLSQQKVAKLIRRPQSHLSMIEAGVRGVYVGQIVELVNLYGLTFVQFAQRFQARLEGEAHLPRGRYVEDKASLAATPSSKASPPRKSAAKPAQRRKVAAAKTVVKKTITRKKARAFS